MLHPGGIRLRPVMYYSPLPRSLALRNGGLWYTYTHCVPYVAEERDVGGVCMCLRRLLLLLLAGVEGGDRVALSILFFSFFEEEDSPPPPPPPLLHTGATD